MSTPTSSSAFISSNSSRKMSAAQDRALELVIVPFPVISHLVPTVEMAKHLINREPRLSVTFLIMNLPTDTKITTHTKPDTPHPGINFIDLPQDKSHVQELLSSPNFMYNFMESHRDPVRVEVAKIIESGPGRLAGLVVDMFCTRMIDVADELRVPSYLFFTCSSAVLGLMFHFQSLSEDQDVMEYEDSDAEVSVPGYVNPVPARVLPSRFFDKDNNSPGVLINIAKRFKAAKGILINTFLELEPYAIKSLSENPEIPPVYPVGPILLANGEEMDGQDGIIGWLDEQPDSSVVFLCFGSKGGFECDQVKQIALALEWSGHRFLWSLRKPPSEEKLQFAGEYEDSDAQLPEGFQQRTAGFGKVIGWAPQMAVLSHRAVGGFVSHCGWNSTLESICCGVPMAVWPIAAEQQANAFQLVKELDMAVEIKMDYKEDSGVIVAAEKIEEAIRQLMDPGNEIRVKSRALKEKSTMALTEAGSSYTFLGRLIEDVCSSIS